MISEAEDKLRVKSQFEQKIDTLNEAVASTYVHLFTRLCTILGYAVILCIFLGALLKVISMCDFTDIVNGIPKVNQWKTSYVLHGTFAISLLLAALVNMYSRFVVGRGFVDEVPSFKISFLVTFCIYIVITSIIFFLTTYASNNYQMDSFAMDFTHTVFFLSVYISFVLYTRSWILNITDALSDQKNSKRENTAKSNVIKDNKVTGSTKFIQIAGLGSGVIIGVFLMTFYIEMGVVVYRLGDTGVKISFALIAHPLICEIILTRVRLQFGLDSFKLHLHPYYEHLVDFMFTSMLNIFRRFLFNDSNDPNLTLLLVIISGLQEILSRSCMEQKEVLLRRLTRRPALSAEDLILKRKSYSSNVTATSIIEIISILISPIMYCFFFDNRFAIDLGYAGLIAIDYESVLLSTILQLIVELLVIYSCSLIEFRNGIPMSDFFFHFRDFSIFFGHFFSYLAACLLILYNFKTIPNKLLCSDSNNVCSCPSFKVYDVFCSNLTKGLVTNMNSTISVNTDSNSGNSNFARAILTIFGLFCTFLVVYFLLSRKESKRKVKVMHNQKIIMKSIIDAATHNMMEKSNLQQSISTIESLCRGILPSQAKVLQSVIETLKRQAMDNNIIDIESVLKENSDGKDDAVTSWLKDQLMSHSQMQMYKSNKNVLGESSNYLSDDLVDKNNNLLNAYSTLSGIDNSSQLIGTDGDDKLDIKSWDFSVFSITCKNPQSWLAWKFFSLNDGSILKELRIPKVQFSNILIFVEQNYSLIDYDLYPAYGGASSANIFVGDSNNNDKKSKKLMIDGNPYHNNLHGADVFQAVLYFSTNYNEIGGNFSSFDLVSILFAAYIHDFNHPGLNSTYMISDWPQSGISSTFGTESPLEKHHLAMAFNLMRNREEYNFLINTNSSKIDYFRKIVTDCVMSTDLAKSMGWISSARISLKDNKNVETDNPLSSGNNNDEKKEIYNKILLMQLAIKCADVGHPCRLLDQHLEWSRRICEEFYSQGDKEKSNGMKISSLCDRNVSMSNYPQSQISFINFVSKPCFTLMDEVCWSVSEDKKPWLKYMKYNVGYWEERKKEAQTSKTIIKDVLE